MGCGLRGKANNVFPQEVKWIYSDYLGESEHLSPLQSVGKEKHGAAYGLYGI